MPDWTKSMKQTFEYYTVDPGTWKNSKKLLNIKSSSITRDSDAATLGSATFEATDMLGECYIRTYIVTSQNGVTEKFPLGTHLVQTPSSSFDGKKRDVSMDAYTPLIELKENTPDLGYSIFKNENIMDNAYNIVRDNARAPVVKAVCDDKLYGDFVANTDDTWLTYTTDLIANAKHLFDLDELGRIIFLPKQELDAMQPVFTYTDDNSSILYDDISVNHDLYNIPNVVEVICATNTGIYHARVVNDDPNSPTSTISRGREIRRMVTDPKISGNPTESMITEYAERLLKELSTLEYTVSYTHAYCPVRLGDCVRLNYTKAGITNIKAKVISQNIKCEPGCPVSEKAVFTQKLWR